MSPSWASPSVGSDPAVGAALSAPLRPDGLPPGPGAWPNPALAGGQSLGPAAMTPELLQLLLLSLLMQQLPMFQGPKNRMVDPFSWNGSSREDLEGESAQNRNSNGQDPARSTVRQDSRAPTAPGRPASHNAPAAQTAPNSAKQPTPGGHGPGAMLAQQRVDRVAIHVMGPATVEVVVQDVDDTAHLNRPTSQITIQVHADGKSTSGASADSSKITLHPLIARLLASVDLGKETREIPSNPMRKRNEEGVGQQRAASQTSSQPQASSGKIGVAGGSPESAADDAGRPAGSGSPATTKREETAPAPFRGQDKGRSAVETDHRASDRSATPASNPQIPASRAKPGLYGFDPSSCIQGEGHASTQTQDPALDPTHRLGALQAAGQSAAAQAQRAGQHTPQGGPGGPSATWFFWAVGGALIGFCAAGMALLFGR